MIAMPVEFAQSTVDREGKAGAAWLAELPGIVEELLGRWGCVPVGEVMHGGVGVIVPVRRRAEGSAVLKVCFHIPAMSMSRMRSLRGAGAAPPCCMSATTSGSRCCWSGFSRRPWRRSRTATRW